MGSNAAMVTDNEQAAARARRDRRGAWREQGLHAGLCLADEIRQGVERWPDTRLIFASLDHPAQTTIAKAWDDAALAAASLHDLGLRPGDTIVSQVPNWLEGLVLYLAAIRLGLVFVPVIHIYGPTEIGYILQKSRAKAIVLPDRWKKLDFAAHLPGMEQVPDLEHVIVVGEMLLPGPSILWRELISKAAPPAPDVRPASDEICLINFTSGTTSQPKGVMHSHDTLAAEIRNYPIYLSEDERDGPSLQMAPGGHITSVINMLRPFLFGESQIYMDQFSAELAVDMITTHRPVLVGGVPMTLNAVFDLLRDDPATGIRYALTGAAGVPPSLIERGDRLGITITKLYGLTEQPTITASHPQDPTVKRATTDGRVLPGNSVRLLDDEGNEVGPGVPGEIVAIGPEQFVGYLESSADADAFTPDGWFRTGDIGIRDEDGFVAIVDRKKDVIIRGGENISSVEVEQALASHPAVADVAAIACPHEVLGECVGVFVVLVPGQSLTIEDIGRHFRELGVARQKTPEHLFFIDQFPRTPLGKIRKAQLRQHMTPTGENA